MFPSALHGVYPLNLEFVAIVFDYRTLFEANAMAIGCGGWGRCHREGGPRRRSEKRAYRNDITGGVQDGTLDGGATNGSTFAMFGRKLFHGSRNKTAKTQKGRCCSETIYGKKNRQNGLVKRAYQILWSNISGNNYEPGIPPLQ